MDERSLRALLAERLHRSATRDRLLSGLHAKQVEALGYLESHDFLAMCASRRAGKTYLSAAMVALSLLDSGKDEWTVYLAPTAEIGKELIWSQLEELNTQHALGWDMRQHPVASITTKTGARFRICGVDDKAQLGKLRGKKYRLAIMDEAKEYSHHLKELVDEIFGPAFIGVGGKLVVTGTPGRVCSGSDYWYSICHALVPGWAQSHYTLRDNPWVKDPDGELAKVRERQQWEDDNVVYLREYCGVWVSDDSERCYAYLAGRNGVHSLPKSYNRATWVHGIGIDFGYKPDPSAWVVVASHPNERDVYVIRSEKRHEMLPDEAAKFTAGLVDEYKPSYVVGDNGGSGKSYVEDYNRRHALSAGIYIKPAEKTAKRDHMEVHSEELRAGRIKVLLPDAGELAKEYENLGWKDQHRLAENPLNDNHLTDAALYCLRHHRAHYHKPVEPDKTAVEVAAQALADRQRRARERNSNQGLLRR